MIYYFMEGEYMEKNKFLVQKEDGFTVSVFEWFKCLIYVMAVLAVCFTFVFRIINVDGTSMCDTLQSGDKVVVTGMFYTPCDGDVIVVSHGEVYSKPIIKRVIATEGQSLKLDYKNNRIIVDGVVIDEPYIKDYTFGKSLSVNEERQNNYDIPEIIPGGKVFVLGDNRDVSKDSRDSEIGLIDVSNIIGKANCIAFPFDHMSVI